MNTSPILVRCWPGILPYFTVLDAMREFTTQRDAETPDQMWLLQHPPVFTLGRNADAADVLDPGSIPVIRSDRGGKVTYHGPGQWIVYLLIDLPRMGINVRQLTSMMEQSVIQLLADHGVNAHARRDAPGVYVGEAKIASLGLRVQRGRSYHGLSLNTDMDLSPFQRIHPCGMPQLAVTQVHDLCPDWPSRDVAEALMNALSDQLQRPLKKGGA
ncbi:lipoyl(octanoyl) transferase LipB [Acidithiobacillus sp.]|uniref:lipoyl(octanoyl) transferase LipB n=1 Tax=Acidithiobacillus sp. TaxID=1872118 RepID=UPI00260B38FC|nr:lipoyl(octanoyl) transferase LipB [Acidithiobacillus sp.]MDD2748628.1 lipoyl(octanoyl) transferase LipB [Acidithiobacillus sp.]MDD5278861.1 lipoyl(octanoyl) transferase LipB [Acidithiobacillus sp.]